MSPLNLPDVSPELQSLIDQGIVTREQAQEAMGESRTAEQFTGFAQCVNADCHAASEEPRQIHLRRETVLHKAVGLPIVESSTTHIMPLDDADLTCPDCGRPCAIQESLPPTYPKILNPVVSA